MKHGHRLSGVTLGVALSLACAAAAADDDARPLASVQVDQVKTFKNLPAEAPQAITYGLPEGHGLACGLLPHGSKTIVPLLEPGEDGEWPSCTSVPEATSFDWHGLPVYVYRYVQRDTREDSVQLDAYIRMGKGGIEGVDGLSPDDQPRTLSIGRAAAWAKASLAAGEAAKDGFVPSKRDTVLGERSFLVVARNAASSACSVHVDRLAAGGALAPATLPCKSILATTSLSTPKADWLVLMTQAPDGRPQGRVFEAGADGVREATDIEGKLASAVASGKVLAVKAELKRLLGG